MKPSLNCWSTVICIVAAAGVALGPPGTATAQPAPNAPSVAAEPPPPPEEPPTTSAGSLGPDVYLEDVTYTVRVAWPRTITVSKRDPEVAYIGTYNGQVLKTTDGGKTWDESRLIIEPPDFYADFGQKLYFGVHRSDKGPNRMLDEVMEERSGRTSQAGRYGGGDSGGGGDGGEGEDARGAAANVNFGIGVPGGAPRLQLLVRKFGKPTSGLNIKQTLLLRGSRPTEVRIIVIHPNNPKIVFACTMFGLYMTYDGGLNWVRTFMGTTPKGRMAFHVAVDPENDKRIFLATGEGLYISEDGGNNYLKTTKKGVGEGVIDWIYFNPYDSRYVFIGTDYGMLRSSDGGTNWQWSYFTTFPDGRVVRSIVIDPFDKKTGYIATHDGTYYTDDMLEGGLEGWKRLGGLTFTGMETSKIEVCPQHKGHMWVLTNMKLFKVTSPGKHDTGGAFVYESLDGGKTWKIIFSGNTDGSMQWFEMDPSDPDLLWLIWSRSLSRMRRRTGEVKKMGKFVIPDDPPIGEVIWAAFRHTGTEPGVALRYRKLSQIKALVPQFNLMFFHHRWSDYQVMRDAAFPMLPYKTDTTWGKDCSDFRVFLNWDLAPLIFNLQTTLFGRLERINYNVGHNLKHAIHRWYGELRRLRVLMANHPPDDLRIRVVYKLRIEELQSYIEFITGGYLARWKRGDKPRGINAKWWVPWVEPDTYYQNLTKRGNKSP